jgi:hypothetical protein
VRDAAPGLKVPTNVKAGALNAYRQIASVVREHVCYVRVCRIQFSLVLRKSPMANSDAALDEIVKFRSRTTASPWIHFPREKYVDELEVRVRDPDLINTSHLNLCGPGAFFRTMATDFPSLYAKIGIELYETGKTEFFGHKIVASEKLLKTVPSGKVPSADYVILASYQNSENLGVGFESENVGFGGITLPGKLADWFRSIGYRAVQNSTDLFVTKGVDHLLAAENYRVHGFRVCLFVNANMLQPSSMTSSSFCPNHWVVLYSPILVQNRHKIQFVEFKVWSWADTYRIPATGYVAGVNLTNNYYGFVAARP